MRSGGGRRGYLESEEVNNDYALVLNLDTSS